MLPTQLFFSDANKDSAITAQNGEKVSLEVYLDNAYRSLFPQTGYQKPRNNREYDLVISYLLLVSHDDKMAKKATGIFETILSL